MMPTTPTLSHSARRLFALAATFASATTIACGDDDAAGINTSDANTSDAASWWQTSTSASDAASSTSTWSPADTSSGWSEVSPTGSPADAAPAGDTGLSTGPDAAPTGNTHIALGGAQDFGYPRALIAAGQVPRPADLDPAGFFAEHSTPLPPPLCGERMCVQAMLAVMGNLLTGQACTMLQLGLNSPIVVDPSQRPPLTLAVVVDVSGSMAEDQRIGYVREGLRKLVNALHDDDRIALVTFDTIVETRIAMTEVRGRRNDLADVIDTLVAEGSTNLHDGLRAGYEEVLDHWESGRQNRVILLSDGMATVGVTADEPILTMSRAFNSDGIGLTTVGLGTSFNLPLMQGLAEQADGNFYFLESATAVDEVFTEEIAYFTLPVAFDVVLDVRTGGDYRLVRASGSDRFMVDAGGGRLEAPSVFFAHRMAHDDVHEGEDGVGRRGGGSALVLELMPLGLGGLDAPSTGHVADVTLTFREPGSDTTKTDAVTVTYPRPPDDILTTGFFDNLIVTKTFVVLNLFVAIETACELFHAGQALSAVNLLARVIAAARDYEDSANDGQGDVDITLDIALMEDLARLIAERGGLNDPPPPPIPDDPWPAD